MILFDAIESDPDARSTITARTGVRHGHPEEPAPVFLCRHDNSYFFHKFYKHSMLDETDRARNGVLSCGLLYLFLPEFSQQTTHRRVRFPTPFAGALHVGLTEMATTDQLLSVDMGTHDCSY
jgi:hypothetical protein